MTGHELEVVEDGPRYIVQPVTGEMIEAGDIAAVGVALDALREHKRRVESAIGAFTEAVIEESRRQGKKTLHVGSFTIKLSGDSEVEWDVTEIVKLLDLGLPPERYAELVTETITYKVNASVAKQIEGSNSEYAEVIARARVRVPKRQYATVLP